MEGELPVVEDDKGSFPVGHDGIEVGGGGDVVGGGGRRMAGKLIKVAGKFIRLKYNKKLEERGWREFFTFSL